MIRVTRSAVIDAPIERVWAVLRDFNSHTAWHPVVAESEIEGGEPSDQVGCVRRFTLRDGNRIREQLLALSDRDHVSTYCILDASVPLRRYVATLQLKRVTDGERTFWHWQSTFDAPPGRERELADMVGTGVYEGGFEGLRAYLRRARHAPDRAAAAARAPRGRRDPARAGRGGLAFGGPEVLRHQSLPARPPGPGEVRIRQTAVGVNYIDVYVRSGLYRLIEPPALLGMEAAGVVVDVGDGVAHLLPGDRVAYACAPPGAYVGARTMAGRPGRGAPGRRGRGDGGRADAEGHDRRLPAASHASRARGRDGPGARRRGRRRALPVPVGQGARREGDRHRVERGQGPARARATAASCRWSAATIDSRAAVKAATSGRGADVIYDGLGRAAMEENLEALALCGHWVSYGQASGPLAPIGPEVLAAKSLTLSRPVLFHYTAERAALNEIAQQTFQSTGDALVLEGVTRMFGALRAIEDVSSRSRRASAGP